MEHLSVDLKISYLGAIYLLRHIGGGGAAKYDEIWLGGGGVSQVWRNIKLMLDIFINWNNTFGDCMARRTR